MHGEDHFTVACQRTRPALPNKFTAQWKDEHSRERNHPVPCTLQWRQLLSFTKLSWYITDLQLHGERIATVTAPFLNPYLVQTNRSSDNHKWYQGLDLFQQKKIINPFHSPTPLLHVFTADISPKVFKTMSCFCPLGKSHSQTFYSNRENLIRDLYLDFHFHIMVDLFLNYCPNHSANSDYAVPTGSESLWFTQSAFQRNSQC